MEKNNSEKLLESVRSILKFERKALECLYGVGTSLSGKCIEASENIKEMLKALGINAETVEGWCVYDNDDSCSDVPWDPHTWVEFDLNGQRYYADITADQFNYSMGPETQFRSIILCVGLPYGMQYEEPTWDEWGEY